MNRTLLIVLLTSVAASTVASVAVTSALGPGDRPVESDGANDDLVREVRALRAQVGDLRREVRRGEAAPVRPEPASAGADATEPPPAESGEAAAAPSSAEKPSSGDRAKKVNEILATLGDGAIREGISSLWETLPGTGLEDDAIKAFRAYVEDRPDDPDAQYGLGVALTTKLMGGAKTQMEVMVLSSQADSAFTRALRLDDDHFEARFSKAISYTFYPAIAGKRPEAIKHFEILRERHGRDPANEDMRQVYFNLGNQYLEAGNSERARAVFREGIGVFPDSVSIRKALEAMD